MLHIASHHGNTNQNHIRNHFTPTRTAGIKTMDVTSVGDDVEKLELSHTADRNAKLSQLL